MSAPTLPRYGWNAYAGRVYHLLTGERDGARRLTTVCARTIGSRNGGASIDRAPAGYTLCRECERRAR
jgi:hypothetical protein